MGWASGSMLAAEIWDTVAPHVAGQHERDVARAIWDAFENNDCDTLDEAEELAAACGYDWVTAWNDEPVCGKWCCEDEAIYKGTVNGRNVFACEEHVGDLENYDTLDIGDDE